MGKASIHRGGTIPDGGGRPAFTLSEPAPSPIPVMIAVPHAGRTYPSQLVEKMRFPGETALKLEDRLVDRLAEVVAESTGATLLVAHAPRAMIDLNRAVEDMDWEMLGPENAFEGAYRQTGRRARSGLGLVPRRISGLGELWKGGLRQSELDARVNGVHAPYHTQLADTLGRIRDRWGAALLVDMHSMPPLVKRAGQGPVADFVVGDRFGASCDGGLCAQIFENLARSGWRVAHNRPYAGGYVLDRHTAPARSLHGIQLEICRATYLDSDLREQGDGFERVADCLTSLVRNLAGEVAAMGRGMAQAAE